MKEWNLLGEVIWQLPDEEVEDFLKEAKHIGLKRKV